ncbi:MAG: hypothetical protein R3195_17040 [Gemmatimonadota bacterium]|nr:hypothetical protein [Gemmatimonadota bacterium]
MSSRYEPLRKMEAASPGPFDEEYVRLRMDYETVRAGLGMRGAS